MSDKPNIYEDSMDLTDLKALLSDMPEVDEEITFESVMAEERFAAVTGPRRKRPAPKTEEEPSPDTLQMAKIAAEMKNLALQAEAKREAELLRTEAPHMAPPPGRQPPESFFAPEPPREPPAPELSPLLDGEEFAKAFAAAAETPPVPEYDDFDEPPEERKPRGEGFLKRLTRYVRKPLPPLEAMPEQAYKRVTPYAASLRLRTVLAFVLSLPLFYAALGRQIGLPMPSFFSYVAEPNRYILITASLQILIMLCAVDVVARGFSDLVHLRPGAETLVTFSGMAALLHAVSLVAEGPLFDSAVVAVFMPYNTLAGISFFFTLWAGYYQYSAYKRTYQTARDCGGSAMVITLETGLWDGLSGYTKRDASLEGFVSRTETPDISRRISALLAPLLLAASLVFAVMVSFGQNRPGYFYWAWSALSLAAAPFSALFAFSLPFARLAKRLNVKGGAIAGWSAVRDLKGGDFMTAEDADFFPPDQITLNGVKVLNDFTIEKVTLYAAAVLEPSGSGMFHALRGAVGGSLEKLPPVTHLEHYEAGGLSGMVNSDTVLVGTSLFVLRNGIKIPNEFLIKRAVYVVINARLAGILAINYIPSGTLPAAVEKLDRHRILPVMATRDFNITDILLKDRYKLNPDLLEYPTIEDRLALSDPGRDTPEKPSAFVVREGLSPAAECVVGAKRLGRVASANLWITLLNTAVTMLGMLYFTHNGGVDAALAVVPGNVLLYQLLWWVPVWIVSGLAHRY